MSRRSGEAPADGTWRLLVEPEGATGAENMAIDQALLDEAATEGTSTLRLYRFNPPCLSLGRNQRDLQVVGINVVRRPTGGGAVWHEHEVTYAVAAPLEPYRSLRAAYRAIHELIAAALRTLGVEPTLAPDRRLIRPPAVCFSSPSGGEILAAGRKLVGSAQVRQRGAFLQHGSILLDGSQETAARVVGEEGNGTGEGYETTLQAELGRVVTFEEVASAVIDVFADPPIALRSGAARPVSQC